MFLVPGRAVLAMLLKPGRAMSMLFVPGRAVLAVFLVPGRAMTGLGTGLRECGRPYAEAEQQS